MASPELDRAIALFRAGKEETQAFTTVEDFRVWYEQFTGQFELPEDAVFEQVGAGGVSAEWVSTPGVAEDRVVMYLHGGGYMIGSMRTHRSPLSYLSRVSDARVLGLNYRLAPEHPFPAAVEDSVAAYNWLLEQGISPGRVVIGGDSCGGGLTIATLVALKYFGYPLPAGGISHSGWTDLAHTGDSFVTKAEEDPLLDRKCWREWRRPTWATGAVPRRWHRPITPTWADCLRCWCRWALRKCCWTTHSGWPKRPRRPAWTLRWRCGTTCPTSGRPSRRSYPKQDRPSKAAASS